MNFNVSRWAVGAWVALLLACAAVIARTTFTADVSAFLPRSPTPAQEILVEQLRDGVVSRLMLIGIEGAPPESLARASRSMAAELRKQDAFVLVENGEGAESAQDREFLWRNRYLLSPAVAPERFSVDALRARLEEHVQQLGSSAGMLVRRTLPGDPTGEFLVLLESLAGQAQPGMRSGVWFSAGGARALLVARTRAAGYDIDAQAQALERVKSAFSRMAGADGATLLVAGPGVFSVKTRAAIKGDATRFSLIATVAVSLLLLALYRSPRLLGLGLLPVASGALAGIAAVGLGFGAVHGITLGFGVTLIGEGVDYAIYLFTQTAPGSEPDRAFARIWPTLRLGVLTSICGFSAMLFSGFTGLAQLGLFSIVGLIVAAAVTRWVVPQLMPRGYAATAVAVFEPGAMAVVRRAPALRVPLLIGVAIALAVLAARRDALWSDDLGSLSPVPRAEQLLDQQLRQDLGAPDVRYLVVITAGEQEAALQSAETVAESLRGAAEQGLLEGYETPTAWLPSRQAQRARQAAIPPPAALYTRLEQALRGLPYRPRVFQPFLADAAAAKSLPLIERSSLDGTRLALKVDALLVQGASGWTAMLPLRGVKDGEGVARSLAIPKGAQARFLDLKRESDALYQAYRSEALTHSLLGAAAIGVLLLVSLRSLRRVFDVLAPLAAAVIVTTCLLVLAGHKLSIFHLVGLLLVVAVGSNYSLFFDRAAPSGADRSRTIVSLLFAAVTTLTGFGLLAFSSVPVLHAIGLTVGMGALLALVFSAILGRGESLATESHGNTRN